MRRQLDELRAVAERLGAEPLVSRAPSELCEEMGLITRGALTALNLGLPDATLSAEPHKASPEPTLFAE